MNFDEETRSFIEKATENKIVFRQIFVFRIRWHGFMVDSDPKKILRILEEAQSFSGGGRSGIHGYLLKTRTRRSNLGESIVFWSQDSESGDNTITLQSWLEEKGINLSDFWGMDWDG